jgi:hypothetical protein
MLKTLRKYKGKYLENKQKNRKSDVFNEKKLFKAHFCPLKEIFLVILRPKSVNDKNDAK